MLISEKFNKFKKMKLFLKIKYHFLLQELQIYPKEFPVNHTDFSHIAVLLKKQKEKKKKSK